ncbi:dienelactone hydrolase family protein [Romeria aff. gracilis LEGE 07310]|uniref:Dienelactone hydrolase family protein n=1 Tax=Vasconcelosia minhoensis LEGE 07310 TaxID=915328 RepID=A0A8J7AJV4_9CYAN|nr:dienelactone hydrolase family protein [Romeria gracilis]MBE9080411.1 dienelactone hydrolase family protein [Romeria aff. gracilis LEGE 07310]
MASNIQVKTETVEVSNGNFKLPAYLALPTDADSDPAPVPAVVVLQEIFGVNAHIRDVTERLARLGYVAIAPALYHRQAPGFEAGYTAADVKLGRQYKVQTRADQLLGDIQAALRYAQNLPQTRSGGAGCIGFCFGGHVAYLAATLPEVAATAAFYGAGITDTSLGPGEPTIACTSEINGILYGFFGQEDDLIPLAAVDEIEAALERENVPHKIFRYADAGHGFFCDRRDSYRPTAAADAWEKTQTLFAQTLQP